MYDEASTQHLISSRQHKRPLNASDFTQDKKRRRTDAKGFEFLPSNVKDLHLTLKRKELSQKLLYASDANEQSCRRMVVDWMQQVGKEAFNLSPLTVNLAVFLYDRVLSAKKQERKLLQLIASCCLLLAAKLEESEAVPSIRLLNFFTQNSYEPAHFKQMEIIILHSLNWDLEVVTPTHFLNYYLTCAVTPDDLFQGQPIHDFEDMKSSLEESCFQILNLCLMEHSFLVFSPSILAASVIFCGRKYLRLKNSRNETTWPDSLRELTSYHESQLQRCITEVTKILPARASRN